VQNQAGRAGKEGKVNTLSWGKGSASGKRTRMESRDEIGP